MVSVIIPVYNCEKYLRQCLDSVLAQTFCDLEVIVVDDGSTDSSPSICDTYAARDHRVHVVHRVNGGLSQARNSGIDIATGEWIAFVDSDDTIAADNIEILLRTARQHGAEIACSTFAFVPKRLDSGSGTVSVMQPDEAIARTLHQTLKVTNSPCGKLYRSDIFDGLRFTPGRWYEDLDLFYKAYAKARLIAFVDRAMYFYRTHDDSFTQQWTPRRLDVLKVMDDMHIWFSENRPSLLAAVHDRHFAAACNMYLLLSRHDPRNPLRTSLWQTIRSRRRQVLYGKGVRLKNRIGALLSYMGPAIFARL